MRYSSLVERMQNDGAAAWETHTLAVAAQARGEDVIVLSVGDPDFDTPAPVRQRAMDAIRGGDTHYPEIAGRDALRRAIASDFAARSGVGYTQRNVIVCAGTQNALAAASMCVLDHGDEVIALEPMYVTYESTLRLGGARLVRVSQRATHGFRPDARAIAAAVTERTRAIVINTPNNPTGVVLDHAELVAIAEIARTRDLWVIADEVYADLIFEGTHLSIASLSGMAERTITVSSVSKSHAMTGWRCGWLIGPAEVAQHVEQVLTNTNYGIPGFVQEAALTAITECSADVAAARETYRRRRALALEELARMPGLDVLRPDAGMYLLVHVAPHVPSTADFIRELYDSTGVSVLDAGAFGASTAGWIRVSFATDDQNLAEGCRRVVRFLEN